jgi:hypothetical protein
MDKQYVVIRMSYGPDVVGVLVSEDSEGILLDDVMTIRYDYTQDGYPTMFLMKYCAVDLSFDAFFKHKDIVNVFRDPVPTLIEYYDKTISKVRRNYSKRFNPDENKYASFFDDQEDSLRDQEEIVLAMAEMFTSNTTIQ